MRPQERMDIRCLAPGIQCPWTRVGVILIGTE